MNENLFNLSMRNRRTIIPKVLLRMFRLTEQDIPTGTLAMSQIHNDFFNHFHDTAHNCDLDYFNIYLSEHSIADIRRLIVVHFNVEDMLYQPEDSEMEQIIREEDQLCQRAVHERYSERADDSEEEEERQMLPVNTNNTGTNIQNLLTNLDNHLNDLNRIEEEVELIVDRYAENNQNLLGQRRQRDESEIIERPVERINQNNQMIIQEINIPNNNEEEPLNFESDEDSILTENNEGITLRERYDHWIEYLRRSNIRDSDDSYRNKMARELERRGEIAQEPDFTSNFQRSDEWYNTLEERIINCNHRRHRREHPRRRYEDEDSENDNDFEEEIRVNRQGNNFREGLNGRLNRNTDFLRTLNIPEERLATISRVINFEQPAIRSRPILIPDGSGQNIVIGQAISIFIEPTHRPSIPIPPPMNNITRLALMEYYRNQGMILGEVEERNGFELLVIDKIPIVVGDLKMVFRNDVPVKRVGAFVCIICMELHTYITCGGAYKHSKNRKTLMNGEAVLINERCCNQFIFCESCRSTVSDEVILACPACKNPILDEGENAWYEEFRSPLTLLNQLPMHYIINPKAKRNEVIDFFSNVNDADFNEMEHLKTLEPEYFDFFVDVHWHTNNNNGQGRSTFGTETRNVQIKYDRGILEFICGTINNNRNRTDLGVQKVYFAKCLYCRITWLINSHYPGSMGHMIHSSPCGEFICKSCISSRGEINCGCIRREVNGSTRSVNCMNGRIIFTPSNTTSVSQTLRHNFEFIWIRDLLKCWGLSYLLFRD
jgi:hypothetical protein